MKAVIVTDLCDPPGPASRFGHCGYLGEVTSARLFNEDMLARVQAGDGDRRKFDMRCRNHDGVDIGCLKRSVEIGCRPRAERLGPFDSSVSCTIDREKRLV